MFGTFEAEERQSDNYGTADQMRTFNAVRMNWRGIAKMMKLRKGKYFGEDRILLTSGYMGV